MNWLLEHIQRLLADRRWRARWQVLGAVMAALVVLGVTGVLTQGADTLSGTLDAASMGVQTEAPEAASEDSSAEESSADTTAWESADESASSAKESAAEENAADADAAGGDEAKAAKADSDSNPSKGKLAEVTFSVKGSDAGAQKLSDADGSDAAHVAAGSTLKLKLAFKVPGGALSGDSEDARTITYELPGGLEFADDGSDGARGDIEGAADTDAAGKKLGTWKVADGKLVMVFNDDEYAALYEDGATAVVTLGAEAVNASESETRDVVFDGVGKITVKPAAAKDAASGEGESVASSAESGSSEDSSVTAADSEEQTNAKQQEDASEGTASGTAENADTAAETTTSESTASSADADADAEAASTSDASNNDSDADATEPDETTVDNNTGTDAALPVENPLENLTDGGSVESENQQAKALPILPTETVSQTLEATNEANPDKGTLTEAKFYTENTSGTVEVTEGTKVKASSRVQFRLTFDIEGGTLSATDNTVTYTLPDGIEVSGSDGDEHDLMGASGTPQAGKKLGTYRIANGKVILTFTQDEVTDLYSTTVGTTVSFWATASNSSVTDDKSYDFNGKGTLVVESTEPQISVNKAVSKVQGTDQWGGNTGDLADGDGNRNRHATYIITVGSTTGTGHEVNITDKMGSGTNVSTTSYDTGTFTLKKYSSVDDETGSTVDFDSDKLTIDNVSSGESGTSHFSLSGLPALNAGERYELTYKATVTESDHSANSRITNSVNASIDATEISQSGEASAAWANQGDLGAQKTARVTDYSNPDNPKEKRIQYQIILTTQNGSGTRIQIGDSAAPGTNIDTSGWSGHERESFYDHDSFTLRKYTGTYTNGQTIDPSAGTDESDKLSNISWNNDSGKPSLGLSIDEPLNKGEYYVLSYTATVYESDHNAADTTMNNNAAARIYPGGNETVASRVSAPVTWHNEIQKSGTFNENTGYIDWVVTVNRNNLDARGLIMEDEVQNDLVTNVRIMRGNSVVRSLDLLSGGHSVATDGYSSNPSTYDPDSKKLHIVLGSWATDTQPYTIRFSTKAPADGTVSNHATVIRNGQEYGSQGVNVGVQRQTQWGIAKSIGTNSGVFNTDTGTYTMSWNATATFPDRDLTSDATNGVLKLTDNLGEVTEPDGTSVSSYNGLHYAVAKDLYAELTGASDSGTTVQLTLHNDADANGNARTYTLRNGVFTSGSGDSAVTLSHVKLTPTFRDAGGSTIGNPGTSDAHVKSFDLVLSTDDGSTLNGRTLTVSNYHSILNASTLPPSTQVAISNSLTSNETSGASSQSQSIQTMSNPLEKQVRTLVSDSSGASRGEGSSSTYTRYFDDGWNGTISGDYDATSGEGVLSDNSDNHSEKAVQYRIAINTSSMDDNATVMVTDQIPEGMEFLNSRFHPVRLTYRTATGSYTGAGSAFEDGNTPTSSNAHPDYSYSSDANLSSDGRTITFKFSLGSKSKNNLNLQKGQYYITYCLTFKDDSAWDSLATSSRTYRNNATMTVNGTTYTDNATVNVTRRVQSVTKTHRGTLTNDRKGKYQVVINPSAADLDQNSDTLQLVDQLDSWNSEQMNPVLDLNSVHLYLYNPNAANGIGVELGKTRYSLQYDQDAGKMTVTVPDSTALVFVYDYEFRMGTNGDWGTSGNNYTATVSNTATLNGSSSSSVSESVRHAASSGEASSRALYLYKVDSENHANTLDGSEFKLYKAGAQSDTWSEVQTTKTITGGRMGSDGNFSPYIEDLSGNGGIHEHDVIYKLVETKAPDGYEKTVSYVVWLNQGETADTAWTTITGSTSGSADAPKLDADGNAVSENAKVSRSDVQFISYYGGNLYIEDQYQSITVTKNWSSTNGLPLDSNDSDLPDNIKLQLKQRAGDSGEWTNYGEVVTVNKPFTADDSWTYTWSSLPQSDGSGQSYQYKVEEVDPSSDWKATYLNNDGIQKGNITITNTRQYSLPQTGGDPLLMFICLAGGVVAAAGIAVLAIRRMARR